MIAYSRFSQELNNLNSFFRATIYSYEQTENLLEYWRKNNIKFDVESDGGLVVKNPHNGYKTRKSAKKTIRKNLSSVIFVKVISALEVYLIDLIKDIFLESKEPFKKTNKIYQFNHAELLSINSHGEIFNKIINKECRELSNGGLEKVFQYYKTNFDIELSQFTPGRTKMEEYHDTRHLLVHRLGKTDQQYRKKYNFDKNTVTVDETYLLDCINDFKKFAEMVNNQIIYYLQTETIIKKKTSKIIERSAIVEIDILDKNYQYGFLDSGFNFWVGDNYVMLSDILDAKIKLNDEKLQLNFSGKNSEIKNYVKILRKHEKAKKINFIFTQNTTFFSKPNRQIILDEEILEKIKNKLPSQPWGKGVHKGIAAELNISNGLVSAAIQQLIARGIFKTQINGVVYDDPT